LGSGVDASAAKSVLPPTIAFSETDSAIASWFATPIHEVELHGPGKPKIFKVHVRAAIASRGTRVPRPPIIAYLI